MLSVLETEAIRDVLERDLFNPGSVNPYLISVLDRLVAGSLILDPFIVSNLEKSLEEASDEKVELQEEVDALEHEVLTLESKVSALDNSLYKMEREKGQLERKIVELEKALTQLTNRDS